MSAVNNFLHLYLNKNPMPEEIHVILKLYGFTFIRKDSKKDPNEPQGYHWLWRNPPLSDDGFELIFYHRLFSDDKYYGSFNSFAIMAGNNKSSDMDIKAIDLYSQLLLDRYGGKLYNPEGEEDSNYICGIDRPHKV